MQPGKHGTTFGGNPVSCAAAGAVLHVIDDDFCHGVATQGQRLAELITECVPGVVEVRGRGLMVGVVLEQPIAQEVVKEALESWADPQRSQPERPTGSPHRLL